MIDSTISGVSAVSYISVAEADTLFAGRLQSVLWDELDTDGKERALITSTRRLDIEVYGAIKKTPTQSLQWPRTGVIDYNGYQVVNTIIPNSLKLALCEYVYFILDDSQILSDTEVETFSNYKVGSIDLAVNSKTAGNLPVAVRKFLENIGPDAWISKSKKSIQMSR